MNDKTWVDFKSIKSAVSIEMVLTRYSVNWLRKKDDELRGRCPIHQGEGKDTFHVNISKNVFNCFSCKKRGNVLDFVAAMEKCSVRDAGVKIMEWFPDGGKETKQGSEEPAKTSASDGRKIWSRIFLGQGVDERSSGDSNSQRKGRVGGVLGASCRRLGTEVQVASGLSQIG